MFEVESRRNIVIQPMTAANLLYVGHEIVSTERPTTQPIGTLDFKFLVISNSDGTINITPRESEDLVRVDIFNNGRRLAVIDMGAYDTIINDNYTIIGDSVTQKFQGRREENPERIADFRLNILNVNTFGRIDFRPIDNWFSLFYQNSDVIQVRPNGNFFETQINRLLRRSSQATSTSTGNESNAMVQSAVNRVIQQVRRVLDEAERPM